MKKPFDEEIDTDFSPKSAPSRISHLHGISIDFTFDSKNASQPISFKDEFLSNITSARDLH
jgi:hypothetical protein